MINELAIKCTSIADNQGLYQDFDFVKQCAYIHAEISEAVEAYTHGKPMICEGIEEGYLEEIADVLIYSLSLLGKCKQFNDFDVDELVNKKIEINSKRVWMHGKEKL